jgi:hypothetical protein
LLSSPAHHKQTILFSDQRRAVKTGLNRFNTGNFASRTPILASQSRQPAENSLARLNSDQYSRRYELTSLPGQTAIDVLGLERLPFLF